MIIMVNSPATYIELKNSHLFTRFLSLTLNFLSVMWVPFQKHGTTVQVAAEQFMSFKHLKISCLSQSFRCNLKYKQNVYFTEIIQKCQTKIVIWKLVAILECSSV